jgi:hypothetical protein
MTNNNLHQQLFDPLSLTSVLLTKAIRLLQCYIENLGYKAQIHFELEGCYRVSEFNHQTPKLNFKKINQCLSELGVDGEIVSEYWRNQWEFVSFFNGQTPLKEAMNLHQVITKLPFLFKKLYSDFGVVETLIEPVVWSGDKGKLATGSNQIFTHDTRAVHIPNAIQLNVSVINSKGNNLIAEDGFGEYLQYCFLRTSFECCLLYLPEEAAFERLALKTRYGLAQELCSPVDISGGHQGSVALYKKIGKHNQHMGEEPLLYDEYNKVLSVQQNWQKTARIEHRLGASSIDYNPYINVLYGLLNIIDAIDAYEINKHLSVPQFVPIPLPLSLFTKNENANVLGAIDIFEASSWFSESLNSAQVKFNRMKSNAVPDCPIQLGDKIKKMILNNYQVNLTK